MSQTVMDTKDRMTVATQAKVTFSQKGRIYLGSEAVGWVSKHYGKWYAQVRDIGADRSKFYGPATLSAVRDEAIRHFNPTQYATA